MRPFAGEVGAGGPGDLASGPGPAEAPHAGPADLPVSRDLDESVLQELPFDLRLRVLHGRLVFPANADALGATGAASTGEAEAGVALPAEPHAPPAG
jgi:hypothetical protein